MSECLEAKTKNSRRDFLFRKERRQIFNLGRQISIWGDKFSIWGDKITNPVPRASRHRKRRSRHRKSRRGTQNRDRGTEKATAALKTGIAARSWLANGWRMAGECPAPQKTHGVKTPRSNAKSKKAMTKILFPRRTKDLSIWTEAGTVSGNGVLGTQTESPRALGRRGAGAPGRGGGEALGRRGVGALGRWGAWRRGLGAVWR